jgi:hypothetical protein
MAASTQGVHDLRERATQRNLLVLERVNAHLAPVTIDYEWDVLPLTPAGAATERHIVAAYVAAAERMVPDPLGFWAEKLNLPARQVATLVTDSPRFQNTLRSRLMKRGGVGYVQPGHDTFSSVEQFHQLILACGALPCATWLDGLSPGEGAMEELLELLVRQGAAALNIIPDRNWNITDPELKAIKVRNLYQVVELAQAWDLPLNVGTEMNSFGQKLVDDYDAPELAPVREAFLDGAHFIYGHTMMQRTQGMGYQSDWAKRCLPTRRARNTFYTQVGYILPPGKPGLVRLAAVSSAMTPDQIPEQSSDAIHG